MKTYQMKLLNANGRVTWTVYSAWNIVDAMRQAAHACEIVLSIREE